MPQNKFKKPSHLFEQNFKWTAISILYGQFKMEVTPPKVKQILREIIQNTVASETKIAQINIFLTETAGLVQKHR